MKTEFDVAIVDDHFAVRDGYKFFLKKMKFIRQVHCFSDGTEFWHEMRKSPFDLVFLDIELRGENGLSIAGKIKQQFPDTRVIILSSHHNKEYVLGAYQNEADGYLFKDAESNEVKQACERVLLNGEKHLNYEAMQIIFNQQEFARKRRSNLKVNLSDREIEIIKLICTGKSNKEIGVILNRDETTISTHRYNIMKKLGIHKSIEIINYAISEGLYTPVRSAQ